MQVLKNLGTALCICAFSTTAIAQLDWQELGREALGSITPTFSSFGFSLAAMGDITGNGVPDLGVGAPGGNLVNNNGKAHFILLDANGDYASTKTVAYPTMSDASPSGAIGNNNSSWFGASVAHVADVDVAGSEFKLVAVGAPRAGDNGNRSGEAFVYSMHANAGAASGDIVNDVLSFGDTPNLMLIAGLNPLTAAGYNHYGWSLAGLGDLDAGSSSDGWGLAVGEPFFSGGGRVWIHKLAVAVNGNVSVSSTVQIDSNSSVFAPGAIMPSDDFGYSVAGVGDINGDFIPDLAVGAPDDDALATNKGEVWILYMNADGSVMEAKRLSDLLTPSSLAGQLGYALAAAGDVDGNGTPDLISSSQPSGEVVTFYLEHDTNALSLLGMNVFTPMDCPSSPDCPDGAIDDFGCSVAVLPDGNGASKVIVGARDTSHIAAAFAGAIWFLKNVGVVGCDPNDCDGDGLSDADAIAGGVMDSNMNGVPDICETAGSVCNGDGGDQLGCTNCPCMNNASPGTIGGCLNSAVTSARLLVQGCSSVALPSGDTADLRFAIDGAPANAFCILNSGDGVAPGNMANPCFGLNTGTQAAAFDGLRCAILNTRRHGGRSANGNGEVGTSVSPWGGEGGPPLGIANAGAGFIAGQTRYFQVIHRDDPLLSCMRGLNTSQAVEIVFTP